VATTQILAALVAALSVRAAKPELRTKLEVTTVQEFEYRTEVLTSMIGRDKVQMGDLDDVLEKYGNDGWELVSLNLDANLQGSKDGHLLVFKRAKS
jgi:Domain of unknown function (DUF4177)